MSTVRTKKSILIMVCCWLGVIMTIGAILRFVVFPYNRNKLIEETGSDGSNIVYKHTINLGMDMFSGYAAIRSEQFKKEVSANSTKLNLIDDKADCATRLKDLQDGKLQMAVFTIDSLIKTTIDLGDMPGKIVMFLDETQGADALVAYKGAVKTLQDLNTAGSTIYLTKDSPSEFLSRTIISSFNLPNLPDKFYTAKDGAAEVLKEMRRADKSKKVAYCLYEPYVSQALNDESVHVIIDSSKLRGYIFDVLVVEPRFLRDNPGVVRSFVESYQKVVYSISKQPDGFANLVMEDARKHSTALTKYQAQNTAKGLVWKNTLENYAHFGLVSSTEGGDLPNIDRIIVNIMDVLVKTNAVPENNFLTGKEKNLYFDGIMRDMQAAKFHPSMGSSSIIDVASGKIELDPIRAVNVLKPLTDEEWKKLVVVGEFRLQPITFGRGKATLGSQAQRDLTEIANRLLNFPNYYLVVVGNARSDGDAEEALKLAQDRSTAAVEYLLKEGVNQTRIKAIASRPSGSSGEAQTVSFVVGQLPY